jgi:EAL domain-containing protein (putative c-di-GMP-specific phosphodiesterase class I)/CheY-like chemotaxis protein
VLVQLNSLQFLVAQADPVQRTTLVDLLGQLGAVRILEVADGPMALRALQDGLAPPVDVAIVDLGLGGTDALELLRDIARLPRPVRVIVTGEHNAGVLFAVEMLARAYGVDLLATVARPVIATRLQDLLADLGPSSMPAVSAPDAVPVLGFAEIGEGLRDGQFEPFFQPRIELASGVVKGVEVFARWRHPAYGLLGPAAFVGALQANGRIDFLDWTMLESAVAHCRALHDAGLALSVSMNLAPGTLAHPQFIRQVTSCLGRHGLLPEHVTFEMPEAYLLDFDAAFIERLVRLRMLGFGLAIDDYGTGRSNLQLLARVPFSELKIDRSFVVGASKNRPLGTVLRSCLTLARSLDRMSTAVGVETQQDWDFLQRLGCTYAQGYFIANPMEAAAIPDWIADWRHFFA